MQLHFFYFFQDQVCKDYIKIKAVAFDQRCPNNDCVEGNILPFDRIVYFLLY